MLPSPEISCRTPIPTGISANVSIDLVPRAIGKTSSPEHWLSIRMIRIYEFKRII